MRVAAARWLALGAALLCAGVAHAKLVGELLPCRANWFVHDVGAPKLAPCAPRAATVLKHHAVSDWVAGEQPAPKRVFGSAAPTPLPVVAVMTHREFVLGCHSFEALWSHRMPTYLVFNADFARAWRLAELVRSKATAQTQLLVLRRLPGELLARSVVLSLLQAQEAGDPEFVFFTHCDIHQLPTWQPRGLSSYVDAVEQLVGDFRREKELRAAGRTAVRFDGPYGHTSPDFWRGNATCAALSGRERSQMPVYAMNAVMVESVSTREHLVGSIVHGVDVGGYVATGGLNESRHARVATPAADDGAGGGGRPWLSDAGTWLEDHALMYDLSLYRAMHATFALADAGDVLFHNEYFQPELLCRMGWTALRDNEVYLHYSSRLEDDARFAAAHQQLARKGKTRVMLAKDGIPVYDGVYERVDLEWLRAFQLELVYARMSPMARVREHVAGSAVFGSRHFLEWGNNVFPLFARASMLPNAILDAPSRKRTVGDLVDVGVGALFAVAGYERTRAKAPADGRRPAVRAAEAARAMDAGHLTLRRVSYPLARFFHVTYADLSNETVREAPLPRRPCGCLYAVAPYTLGNDVGSCTLFLDLETSDRRRIGVWASNFVRYSGCADGSRAPPVLRLPLDARVRAVGSPFLATPGRSVPASAVLRAFGELCARRGLPMAASVAALRVGGPWWRALLPSALARAAGVYEDSAAWPDLGPFLPEGNQTWYAHMRTMPPLTVSGSLDVDMFGYTQGVRPVALRTLCRRIVVRYTWRDKIMPHLCSSQARAPEAAGPGQAICCSMTPCTPSDAFRM
ncbi:hypothetical protein KFE25_001681 [Diacronema lutheri]|uniref:Protein xylosyltransferase n=1 Tax=Diacronema lutheri TaxID=2081491 RepID=A0A8J6CCW2_DIALT|nr:hypothetical protein KFE25_001681 [Diacronema lutheri]